MRAAASRSRRLRALPVTATVLLCCFWLVAGYVVDGDPFDIYPWGLTPTVDLDRKLPDARYYIRAIAKRPDVDMVVIGSSPAIGYTPQDLRRFFPAARHPVNLSYVAGRPLDREMTIAEIVRWSRASRVQIWLDWFYTDPRRRAADDFPTYLYDDQWWNDLRAINSNGASAWFESLAHKPATAGDRLAFPWMGKSSFKARDTAAKALEVDRLRSGVALPHARNCDELSNFAPLVASVRAMARFPGRTIDLIVPANSLYFYYETGRAHSIVTLSDHLLFMKCLVDQLAGLPGVKIHALDADEALTGDLANFYDGGHLRNPSGFERALQDVAQGRYLLRPETVDSYSSRLQHRVEQYRFAGRAIAR